MDLLNRLRSSEVAARRARLAGFAAVLVVAACAFLSRFAPEIASPRFDHSLHGAALELECATCHRGAEDADDAGMPQASQCRLCHKEIDADKPPERHADVLIADGEVISAHVTDVSEEIRFSHGSHVGTHKIACAECHGDVSAAGVVSTASRVTMAACITCHEQRLGRSEECAACHLEVRADRAPPDHLREWMRRHGGVVRMQGSAEAANCTWCHSEQRDCVGCHDAEAPSDHTNYWRQRGHGIAVRIDRERCSTCHQPDSCDRCHDETAPRSHTASFGSPLDRHCISCHLPVATSSCSTCHKGTPSHALAAPQPPDHVPGMNCRQCHGLSAPLPHPDKGDACESCHR